MQQIFNYSGDSSFLPGGPIYPNPKEASLLLSLAPQVDFYVPLRKKSRISAPFLFIEEKKPASIEVLPDECLFEVFRRLSGGEERCACAGVSKKWLLLVSSIRKNEICSKKIVSADEKEHKYEEEDQDIDNDGYLSRSLEGKNATDIRLAAIAVGTSHRGGLGKLSIRGTSSTKALTNLGLKVIGRSCSSFRSLSLWNVSSIGDEGLLAIANGCPLLEKLDLCQCPNITDKSLVAIAMKCPNLKSVSIDSCCKIGNQSLQAFGSFSRNLVSMSISKCPLVGDHGIVGLLSSLAGSSLTDLKLQSLHISDISLAVIGHYGKTLIDLALCVLQYVGERGFWAMGKANGLQNLRSFTINSCNGITDLGLEALGKGCPKMKQFSLVKSALLSDNGLVAFAKSATSLESLKLKECHRVTQFGFFGVLSGDKLKAIALVNCLGYKEFVVGFHGMKPCASLQYLTIRNCSGFGNVSVSILGKLCPNLLGVEFNGLSGITDEGLIPLIQNCQGDLLKKVNLTGCINLTDKVVSVIANKHGFALEHLILGGCKYITDASLSFIAKNCSWLRELDVSKCAITDLGIATLAGGCQVGVQVMSVSGCSLTDKSGPYFLRMGQALKELNLQHCKGISYSTINVLIERLYRCDIRN